MKVINAIDIECDEWKADLYLFENFDEYKRTKLNPNKSTSGHKHAGQEEVYVFYKGTGIMQIDDSKFKVKQGDVIPVPDGAFHRVFNESSEILEFAAIFNGERHTEDKPS